MKYILLILFIICIMVSFSLKGKIIVVNLVIPDHLLRYYEWLISFPSVEVIPVTPAPEKIPSNQTYHL